MNQLGETIKTVVEDRARTNRWFRMNASVARGLPWSEDAPLTVNVVHQTGGADPKPIDIIPQLPALPPTGQSQSTGMPTWLKALITAGFLAAAGGGGAMLTRFLSSPGTTTVVDKASDGSVLQYLEDSGFHLPVQ